MVMSVGERVTLTGVGVLLASLQDLWDFCSLDLIEHALAHAVTIQDELLRLLPLCFTVEVQQQPLDDGLQLL